MGFDIPLNPVALGSAWKSAEEYVKRNGTLVGVSMPVIVEHAVSVYLNNTQLGLLERYQLFCATPPDGWYNFGYHVDSDVELEFHGEDLNGLPVWERPV